MLDKDDMEEDVDEPLSARIPPGCALGSTFNASMDSGGSTTMNSTGISSEFTGLGQSLSSTLMTEYLSSLNVEPSLAPDKALRRPQTADPRVIEDLKNAIEADTDLLPGGSEIHQKTCALRQKTLDLIAREKEIGSWGQSVPQQAPVDNQRFGTGTMPYCARPGLLLGQCPHPSYMHHTDEVWREYIIRERKKFFTSSPPRTAPQEGVEAKRAPAPPAPRSKPKDAGLNWDPRPQVRRVGHGPRGGGFARNQHVALLGGVPVHCVDLEH
jgi:hypothetical protein